MKKKAKILLIEDDLITADYIKDILQEDFNYKVIGIYSKGREAIKAVDKKAPDLIIADINLIGDMNGFETVKEINKNRKIPVIYLTAYEDHKVFAHIKKSGPYNYLVKPVNNRMLETTIENAFYRQKLEKALQQSERQELELQAIYDNVPQLLLLVDKNRIIRKMNNNPFDSLHGSIRHTTGVRCGEALNCIHADEYNKDPDNQYCASCKIKQIINKTFATGKPVYREEYLLEYRSENKLKEMNLLISSSCLLKLQGDYILLCIEDITRQRYLESEQILKERLLQRAQRLSSLGELSSAIGHEINQPLQALKVLASSALFWKEENLQMSEKQHYDNYTDIIKSVDRIDAIIKNMKKILQSPDTMELTYLQLNRIVEESINIYKQKFKNNNIVCKTIFADNLPAVKISDVQMQQVISNLINNSIQAFTLKKTRKKLINIETRLSADGKEVLFIFKDNGPGIVNDAKDKIFNPFFSKNQEKSNLGMGLYIVNNIIQAFSAEIAVEDNKPQGTVFTIRFKS